MKFPRWTWCACGITLALVPVTALAQEDVPAVNSSNWFDHFVMAGGNITYVLITLSITSLALMILNGLAVRRNRIVAPEQGEALLELINEKKYVEAIQYSAEDATMLSYVVHAGLIEAANGYHAMERAVEEALEDRSARLFRKIEWLSIIGAVSPMLGLLGTVWGMINLFAEIEEAGAIPPPGKIAGSISIALVTTLWGLVVAIPSLAAFGVFRNRIDVLTAECAMASERLLSIFKPGAGSSAAASRPKPARAGQAKATQTTVPSSG